MTNDLVRRLRWSADGWDDCEEPENAKMDREAADRIEELEAKIKEYEGGLAAIEQWVKTGGVPK